jgi:hypothetical protein
MIHDEIRAEDRLAIRMLFKIISASVYGIDAHAVEVEEIRER